MITHTHNEDLIGDTKPEVRFNGNDLVIHRVTTRTAGIVNQLMLTLDTVPEKQRLKIAYRLALRLIEAFGEAGVLAGD